MKDEPTVSSLFEGLHGQLSCFVNIRSFSRCNNYVIPLRKFVTYFK